MIMEREREIEIATSSYDDEVVNKGPGYLVPLKSKIIFMGLENVQNQCPSKARRSVVLARSSTDDNDSHGSPRCPMRKEWAKCVPLMRVCARSLADTHIHTHTLA